MLGMKRLVFEKPNRWGVTVGSFLQWIFTKLWDSMQNLLMANSKRKILNNFACAHNGCDGLKSLFLKKMNIVNQTHENHLLLPHIDFGLGSLSPISGRIIPSVFIPVG